MSLMGSEAAEEVEEYTLDISDEEIAQVCMIMNLEKPGERGRRETATCYNEVMKKRKKR